MRVLVSPVPAAFLPRIPNQGASPGTPRASGLLPRQHRSVAAAAAATGDHWGADQQPYRGSSRGGGARRRAGPSVLCDVDVVLWRERRVFASLAVAADVDTVWRIITDYERLADFVPNLVHSGRILCPDEGRIWLEQRGLQQALYWHIEARFVLDSGRSPVLFKADAFSNHRGCSCSPARALPPPRGVRNPIDTSRGALSLYRTATVAMLLWSRLQVESFEAKVNK